LIKDISPSVKTAACDLLILINVSVHLNPPQATVNTITRHYTLFCICMANMLSNGKKV